MDLSDADTASEVEAAFNLNNLDPVDSGGEDIFDFEALVKQSGVDLGELDSLLNQPSPPTESQDESEDWLNFS